MRIASLSPSSTEILFALGAGDDVVGVTQQCDFPPAAYQRERTGTWLHVDLSQVERLQPDLIVTTSFIPVELQTHPLAGRVYHLEPTSLSSVLESMLLLGSAVGRTQQAQRLVDGMQRRFEEIRCAAPAHPLRVYCEQTANPPTQAGYWIPEVISIAGGVPSGGLHALPGTPTAVDGLRAADPDVMVFHWCDAPVDDSHEYIQQRSGWSSLRAVQSNALAYIPGDLLNRPGPRLVEGARKLQAILHAHQRLP